MTYLVDTNVISSVRRGRKGNARVRHWVNSVAPDDLNVSALTFGEIRRGIEAVRSRDARQATAIERWMEALRDGFGQRVLGLDDAIIDLWGRLNARRMYPSIDALIAATALHHGLTLATRNVKDFADTGVSILNPFE